MPLKQGPAGMAPYPGSMDISVRAVRFLEMIDTLSIRLL
jgi:hypothetical protein